MDQTLLGQAINSLKQNHVNFSMDTHINSGIAHVRGMFFYDTDNDKQIKNALNGDILKHTKLNKTATWYLGDKKKVYYLKFKDELEMEISELEKYNVNNYS